ncbi:Esterase/lipase superfamily enzyme [Maribacter orientalis]|uniref:Esterase/lipase superfamily enzyme n=1 Tax=Maribacter orientalis TaxID=228957 RepID=A0A1H7LNW6_9FLAO|nr:alpha/beta hydrolase-fold protein [Maribacter orientalis]SEL00610.1 Esterase/lipase superfamily enzyme [Maribacter orientalis]
MAKVEHIQYYSNTLNRNINLEVTGHWGHPILMFPSSGGQFTQNTDFGLVDSVMNFIEEGKVKIYNVETIDMMSFYDDHMDSGTKIHNYELYMQFLKNELIPYIQKECNTHRIGVSGVSFGGFHAANAAFRFPDLISHYIGMSAAFNIRSMTPQSDDMRIYYNCPDEYMLHEESWKYDHMQIVLGTSDWDICLDKNRNMSAILKRKGITHWYDEKKWIDHDWPLWKMMFPEYLGAYFN